MSESKSSSEAGENIKVVVRCRPLSDSEKEQGFYNIVDVDRKLSAIRVTRPSEQGGGPDEPPKTFSFDYVYPPNTPQRLIFDETARPIVESVLDGYNGTIFAYGQTGTGKTFTMEGDINNPELRGILPNTFEYIFNSVDTASENVEFLVRASFLEVYMDEVYDLLNSSQQRKKMKLKLDANKKAYVAELTTVVVKSPQELFNLLVEGQRQRRVGATAMNKGSSRSHSIFTITVETSTVDPSSGARSFKQGKLNLVDLAGSERQSKTHAEGERMEEANFINLSLSTLGNVIKALASKASHVPYRESKLTRLLEDSLGGNTKTAMIANIGPANSNFAETMSTLRYADRAKSIKNKPRINEDPKDTMLRQMQDEFAMLKAQLLAKQKGLDLSKMTQEQILALGLTGMVPEGMEVSPDGQEIIKVKIIDTGIKVEELQRILAEAEAEVRDMESKTAAEQEAALRKKAEAERNLAELERELARQRELLNKEEQETKELQERIAKKQLEHLKGGGHVERAAQKRLELKKLEDELRARRKEQAELQARIEQQERQAHENMLTMEGMRLSLKELQANIKRKRSEWKVLQEELKQKQIEMEKEKLALEQARDEKLGKCALNRLVLESFIPRKYYQLLLNMREWDASSDSWTFPGMDLSCFASSDPQPDTEPGRELHLQYLQSHLPPMPHEIFPSYPDM